MLDWLLPESASTHAAGIDSLFSLVLVITGVVFIAVQVTLVVVQIRIRWGGRRPGG
jgi:heme/copper-type cytochrome/quinol oxidase subunit 2